MMFRAREPQTEVQELAPLKYRGRLFRKYVTLFAIIVCVALILNGVFGIWIIHNQEQQSIVRIQTQQA